MHEHKHLNFWVTHTVPAHRQERPQDTHDMKAGCVLSTQWQQSESHDMQSAPRRSLQSSLNPAVVTRQHTAKSRPAANARDIPSETSLIVGSLISCGGSLPSSLPPRGSRGVRPSSSMDIMQNTARWVEADGLGKFPLVPHSAVEAAPWNHAQFPRTLLYASKGVFS